MSKITITYFQCDCCGSKFRTDKTKTVTLPVKIYDDEGRPMRQIEPRAVALCPDCLEKLHNVIRANFAVISDVYGVKVEPRFETKNVINELEV